MSSTAASDFGYVACNCCGKIACINARRQVLVWKLCPKCRYAYNPSKFISPDDPNARFIRTPVMYGPEGLRTIPLDHFYWDTNEPMPQYRNCYNLLTYKPEEVRIQPVKVPVSLPNYAWLIRQAHSDRPIVSSDSDSE